MNALKKDLKNELSALCEPIETVFIGGGTPSCINALEYQEVFEIIVPHLQKNAEITTEANPNSATKEWLEKMFAFGVNRVSFGVQSFNDEKLKFLGRAHNAQKAKEAIQIAHSIGFKKINCDLIYGVFNDTIESLKKDIDIVKHLPVDHISVYSLTLEEGTPFFQNNSVKIDDEALSYQLFESLEHVGFHQYEISNFAQKDSSRSSHNIGYWQHKEYLGIGAGAVSYVKGKRVYTTKEIERYIKNYSENEEEILSKEDIKMEKVLLGFRCFIGVSSELFNENELLKVDDLVQNNQLYIKNNRIFTRNFLLADELALYILD
jgi:oxygen-independent coproporphyrinogen III oxidase